MSKLIDKIRASKKEPAAMMELSKIRRLVSLKNSDNRLHSHNSGQNAGINSARRGNVFVPFEAAQPADQQFKNLRELGAGHYFGEISLLTNLRVTATVFASHYLTCAQIIDKKFLSIVRHSSDFKRNLMVSIGEYKDPIFRNYVEIIRNAFIFKQMNSETL